jgi:16S rRNA (cytidine1402-2'-O)-methyltransferase
MTPKGRLYLVPVPLDLGSDAQVSLDEVLPLKTLRTAASLTHWIAENAKSTRAFLKRVNLQLPLSHPIQSQSIQELPRQAHKQGDHLHDPDVAALLMPALQGHDMGLVSEAGMPAVADPGSSVVRAAHRLGIEVIPLVGPSSPLLALAASGMNGQSFAFWGYLPIEAGERIKAIQRLEVLAKQGQAQMFIEVPHRNAALFQSLIETLQSDTHLCLASNLTQASERIVSRSIQAWRQSPVPVDKQQAVLFVMGRWPA